VKRIALAVALLVPVVLLARSFGFLRAAVGIGMAAGIFYLGLAYFRGAAQMPPEPEVEDVSDESLRYVCTMCGLELKVEVAASDRAPTHCREKMILVDGRRRPPLKPV